LLITHDLATPAKDLFARYAERMIVENELDAYIGGFHLDALTTGVPLNVDPHTPLPLIARHLHPLLPPQTPPPDNPPPHPTFPHPPTPLPTPPRALHAAWTRPPPPRPLTHAGSAALQAPPPGGDSCPVRFGFPPR